MYSIRTNGDNIAREFANLLGNSQSMKKTAQDASEEAPPTQDTPEEDDRGWGAVEALKRGENPETFQQKMMKQLLESASEHVDEAEKSDPREEFGKMLDEQLGSEERLADDNLSDYSDEALSDLLVEPSDEVSDGATDSVDDAISAFSSQADPAGQYIMNGLGKIAGSLRAKGEGFAADVVEATALSIRGDLVKEANRKSGIISALNKMASDFSSNGDSFAADMVKVTINKISR